MLNFHNHMDTALEPTIQKVVSVAFETLKLSESDVLNVIIVDDAKMQDVNRTFAGKDATTDVLSFPSGLEGEIGDVFISLNKAQAQAESLGHSLEREVGFLTVHGLLHCIGYTHDTEEELSLMTEKQEAILLSAELPRS